MLFTKSKYRTHFTVWDIARTAWLQSMLRPLCCVNANVKAAHVLECLHQHWVRLGNKSCFSHQKDIKQQTGLNNGVKIATLIRYMLKSY